MKRKALALTFVLALLFSAVAGIRLISIGKANSILVITDAPVHPQVTILSPENNSVYASNALTIAFNVSMNFDEYASSKGYVVYRGHIIYVAYEASWQQDNILIYDSQTNGSLSELSYKLNLTEIPEGKQTVQISARGSGWYDSGNDIVTFGDAYNSTSVSFTIHRVSISSPQNKTYNTSDVPLLFDVPDAFEPVAYSLDAKDKVAVSENASLTGLTNGDHNVTVYVMDKAGNLRASETIHFKVEVPFPTALVAAASGATAIAVGACFLVYFKKRRH